MPLINDSSDYTRRLRLRAISFGNQVADASKFRAPTSRSSYNASVFVNRGGACNDLCSVPKHNIANLMRLPYKGPVFDRYNS
jgi:hypothetical protein